MLLRDASERRQPLAKEAMAVLAAVYVSVADHVRVIVRDRQMCVDSVEVIDIIVDRVIVCTQDHASIAVLSDLFINVLKIFSDQKPNTSVGTTESLVAVFSVRKEHFYRIPVYQQQPTELLTTGNYDWSDERTIDIYTMQSCFVMPCHTIATRFIPRTGFRGEYC
jgi:hypothetical protein